MSRAQIEDLPVGVVVRSGSSLSLNRAAEQLVGCSSAELCDIDAWFVRLFRDRAAHERAAYERYRDSGFLGRIEIVLHGEGSARKIVELTGCARSDGSEVWTLYDVTERDVAAEHFRILFERSTDAHLLFDERGIIDCNQAAVEMLRCADKAQLLATHPAVFSPELQPDGQSSIEKSIEMDRIAKERGYHRFDWIHRRLDGTELPVEVTLNPVLLGSGPALLVVWHDLTARAENERRLAAARDRALEGTRTKSVFLANMSHELRTPLNAIIGYSELLTEEASESAVEMVGDLAKINQAGRHLLTLINDILDLSKIEAGHLALHSEWIDAATAVREAAESIAPLAQRNGNTLSVELSPDLGQMYVDPTRLRQVLINLLSNASKFTQDGKLGIRGRKVMKGASARLAFEIWDTGIGIESDLLARIFDEFVQGDPSTTRRFGGTGLGLAITRRLCQRMEAEIAVSSVPGQGSCFVVDFPVDPRAHTPPATISAVSAEETLPEGAPEVIVIDDDPDARELLRRMLAAGGFRALLASSGREGLDLCRSRSPAAVTLDVLMPAPNGWDVLSELKGDPALKEIPVVMVSTHLDSAKGFALGACEYLSKPIDREALIAALERHRPARGRGSVLVVDDDDVFRALVMRGLPKSDWVVTCARDGSEAMSLLSRQRPDIVLLDLMMPVMDGFQLLAALRATPEFRELPVIVVTARELSPGEQEELEQHAHHVIGKGGVTTDLLMQQLDRVSRASISRR